MICSEAWCDRRLLNQLLLLGNSQLKKNLVYKLQGKRIFDVIWTCVYVLSLNKFCTFFSRFLQLVPPTDRSTVMNECPYYISNRIQTLINKKARAKSQCYQIKLASTKKIPRNIQQEKWIFTNISYAYLRKPRNHVLLSTILGIQGAFENTLHLYKHI